ncbi:MAG: MFS transporter, partial [Janthinobacterium lividum]
NQRGLGFSVQTFLIGIGAVAGSWLPYIFSEYMGISKIADQNHIPNNVLFSFYTGAAVLVGSLLWTIFTTKEYPPEEQLTFQPETTQEESKGLSAIFKDFLNMPATMRQLGLVQFFSWFALFSMWVFAAPAITQHVYHVAPNDTSSAKFADAGNWVGILFGTYNGISAIYALMLPTLSRLTSRKITHAFSLIIGGAGLLSIFFIQDPKMLIISMIGIGLAWGSILAMPYAILSGSIPAQKMGVYMGIFNFFITLPQIINGLFGGLIVKDLFGGHAIYAIVLAGLFMFCAAISVLFIQDEKDVDFSPEL